MKRFLLACALVALVTPLVGCNMGAGNPSRSGAASPGVAPVNPGYAAPAPAPAAAPAPSGSSCGAGGKACG